MSQTQEWAFNPGPQPVDPNLVICVICSKAINRRPNLEPVLSCSNDNCDARCHLRCNRLTTALNHHARNENKEIHWFCPQHYNGKAQVNTPTQAAVAPSVTFERKQASAAGKAYSICKKIIQARYTASTNHCSNPSCDQISHLILTCSGFIEPRIEARDCVLATQEWKCRQHSELRTQERQPIKQQRM